MSTYTISNYITRQYGFLTRDHKLIVSGYTGGSTLSISLNTFSPSADGGCPMFVWNNLEVAKSVLTGLSEKAPREYRVFKGNTEIADDAEKVELIEGLILVESKSIHSHVLKTLSDKEIRIAEEEIKIRSEMLDLCKKIGKEVSVYSIADCKKILDKFI